MFKELTNFVSGLTKEELVYLLYKKHLPKTHLKNEKYYLKQN